MENGSFTSALKDGLVESLSTNVSTDNVTVSQINVTDPKSGRRLSEFKRVRVQFELQTEDEEQA